MSREIPIIFNCDMVRAILSGQKTQTRRPLSAKSIKALNQAATIGECSDFLGAGKLGQNDLAYIREFCPFGQPGDLLWVRESAQVLAVRSGGLREIDVRYIADGAIATVPYPSRLAPAPMGKKLANGTYREASRILLRVTAVRVERVQDISEIDAEAEGSKKMGYDGEQFWLAPESGSFRCGFAGLWNHIYRTWDANPWVWVIEFERVTDSKREAA